MPQATFTIVLKITNIGKEQAEFLEDELAYIIGEEIKHYGGSGYIFDDLTCNSTSVPICGAPSSVVCDPRCPGVAQCPFDLEDEENRMSCYYFGEEFQEDLKQQVAILEEFQKRRKH